jgi:hypothetical protein
MVRTYPPVPNNCFPHFYPHSDKAIGRIDAVLYKVALFT